MKKLRLNADDIRVVGFEVVSPDTAPRGTVMGKEGPPTWLCETNNEDPTCRLGSCNTGNPCSFCP